MTNKEGKFCGNVKVTFVDSIDAVETYSGLNDCIFAGRQITLAPFINKYIAEESGVVCGRAKSDLMKKKLEKARNVKSYNLLYVSQYAAMNIVLNELNLSYDMLIDNSTDLSSLVAKSALAESLVLQKVKAWLVSLNLNEKIFEFSGNSLLGAQLSSKEQRSQRTLFIKHLGPWVVADELYALFKKYGNISCFEISPTNTIGFVSYFSDAHCQYAFNALLQYEYKGYPLYLEYAPKSLDLVKGHIESTENSQNALQECETSVKTANNTLYISNINFETSEEKLIEYFSKLDGFRKFTLLKSRKNNNSIGHGFATFATSENAQDAIRKLVSVTIDGHLLTIEYAKRQINTDEQEDEDVEGLSEFKTTKLLIKNLAFETNIKDLKSLFGSIVKVKSIRLPKKANGTPRGFAFVEFHSLPDLKKTVNKLSNVHLLGRRMIFLPSNQNGEE